METTSEGGASLQATGAETPLIEALDIAKSFGAVRALKGVSLSFKRGEVHGLVGANGAGKSTFLDIVGGVVLPSSGTVRVDGQEVFLESPRDAEKLGFAFIHQELPLVPDFSAIENMTLAMRSRWGVTNRREHARVAKAAADRVGATFSLRRPVRELSAAERGLVAIAQALVVDARFIAMDEPTAALSETECARLFEVIRELAQSGVAIAYVSHRLDEIEELSHRVTVFKDGEVAGRFDKGDYTRRDLVLGITGSESLVPRLYRQASAFEQKVRAMPDLQDVTSDLQIKNPQVTVQIDRDRAASMGVSAQQIEDSLYSAYGSRQVSTIFAPNNQYRVVMELEPEYQRDPAALGLLYVRSASGTLVPLSLAGVLSNAASARSRSTISARSPRSRSRST